MASRKNLAASLLRRFLLVSVVPILVVGSFSQYYLSARITQSLEMKNKMLADAMSLKIRQELGEGVSILRQVTAFMGITITS